MSDQTESQPTSRRYMSVDMYHPFEDFFQDPHDAERIVRRRWRKYAGDNISEEELWERYRGLSDSYRTKPELDKSEDESEEAIAASAQDPDRFGNDKKRNLLIVTLFLNRRIPGYLKENPNDVFTASSAGSVFQSLAREICQEEPKLRGTTSKDLVSVYARVVEHAEKLSRILETDTKTGWRESFRKTTFSTEAEKLANLDRGFRGKKRLLRLEYIGPEPEDVVALEEEEARENLPRTRGRDRRASSGQPPTARLTAVVIPVVKLRPIPSNKRKRPVKSLGSSSSKVAKKTPRQSSSKQKPPTPTSRALSQSPHLSREEHSQGHRLGSGRPHKSSTGGIAQYALPDRGIDFPVYFNSAADEGDDGCIDMEAKDTHTSRNLPSIGLLHRNTPRAHTSTRQLSANFSEYRRTDQYIPRNTPTAQVNSAHKHVLRRTTTSAPTKYGRLQNAMLAFQMDMDTQVQELTNVLQDQKEQLDEFSRSAEDLLFAISGR
ncbi:hypothetical protein EC991_004724 [Linnemannia zychae]|nr:hypothetical protein EC991_004724 [Linnemannia zychae]